MDWNLKNLNYNSQIFTLTSLFLHSTSSSINTSSRLQPSLPLLLFFSSEIQTVAGLLLLLLLRSLITVTDSKSKKFLSSLKFIFMFLFFIFFYFYLCYIALPSALAVCPLCFFYGLWWLCVLTVFVSCGFYWTGVFTVLVPMCGP